MNTAALWVIPLILTPPPQPAMDIAGRQAIADILQARQGHDDLFEGTIFADPQRVLGHPATAALGERVPTDSTSEFRQVLTRIVAQTRRPPVIEPGASPVFDRGLDDVAGGWAGRAESLVEQMRSTARQLESRAADCEQVGQYDQADRLRRLAVGLWREARQLPIAATEDRSRMRSGVGTMPRDSAERIEAGRTDGDRTARSPRPANAR